MAIPNGVTILQYYNQQINTLTHLRDKYATYDEDWNSLPTAVKTAIKANVDSTILSVQTALTEVDAAVQARV